MPGDVRATDSRAAGRARPSVELQLCGPTDSGATTAHPQLLVDVGDVGLGRVQGDELRLGDLRVGEVGGEVLEDHPLPFGQPLAPARAVVVLPADDPAE